MIFRNRRFTATIIAVILTCFIASPVQAAEQTDDLTAATVNGVPISRKAVDSKLAGVLRQFMQRGMSVPESAMGDIRNKVLDNLIDEELLFQRSQVEDIKATDQMVDAELEKIKSARFKSDADYQSALTASGISESDIRKRIERALSIQQLVEKRILADISISGEDSKRFYDDNPKLFTEPEQVDASHILIRVKPEDDDKTKKAARDKLHDIRKQIEKGSAFDEMARTYSEGPSKERGGELGFFKRGDMVKAFEDKAFSMKVGEISDIVETQFGYHLIKVNAHKTEALVPYDQSKQRIDAHLKNEEAKKRLASYVASLRKEADIVRHDSPDKP